MIFRSLCLALARQLLRLAVDETLQRALPTIYRRLDQELPYWLQSSAAPFQVRGTISSVISDALERKALPSEVGLVQLLYDPAQAFSNAIQIRQRP